MSYLDYLRSFSAVYRQGSISRAATVLGLTQPALSRHIQLLESHFSQPLFQRLPRGIIATPAGHDLARLAAPHLDALEALVREGLRGETLAGPLLVGCSSGLTRLLLGSLGGLAEQGIRLMLDVLPPPALLEALAERRLELALTPAPIPHKGVRYELIYEGPLQLVAAPRWQERLPRQGAPRGLPLIEVQGPHSLLEAYWQSRFEEPPEAPALRLADWQDAVDAAVAGAGLAVVPACLCREALASGQLLGLNASRAAPRQSLYLAEARGTASARTAHVVARLKEAAARW